jgi:uncharacterized membrane protein
MRTGIEEIRAYGKPLDAWKTTFTEESLTRQDQADLVNINKIYAKTQRGEIVLASAYNPEYGDFSNVGTYEEVLNKINAAEEQFFSLPAAERRKYNDDPRFYYDEIVRETVEKADKQAAEAAKKAKAEAEAKKLEDARQYIKENSNDSE